MLQRLAILEGEPYFPEPLHVGRPNVGNTEALFQRIQGALDRKWLTNDGPLVRDFEERVADYLGVKHCLTTCNATVGLEIACRAAGLTGEVIVPSFTFVATAHALQWQGITPVFCDVEPVTHTIDPARVEELITPRTSGIVGVHVWGRACAVDELTAIAHRNNLALLFDAAHAFGCTYRQQRLGSFGDAEVFSFHATKFMNSCEGGAITTNDDAFAEKVRLMRNFGFSGVDNVVCMGTNGKMTEIAAAMGLTSLDSVDEFIAANERNYASYAEELERIPGLTLQRYSDCEQSNFQYVVVDVDTDQFGLSRDELVRVLLAENVLARRYFYPACHRMEPYRAMHLRSGATLPVTEELCTRLLQLPTGNNIDRADIGGIGEILRAAHRRAGAIRAVLDHDGKTERRTCDGDAA